MDAWYIAVIYNTIVNTAQKNYNKTSVRSIALTNDTPYLALTGELWDVFREFYQEKWPRYIESALCYQLISISVQTPQWWRHQMETFSALLALCEGNPPVTVVSPHKSQWRGALMFSLIWTNVWANNPDAGDLRGRRSYYDATCMVLAWIWRWSW